MSFSLRRFLILFFLTSILFAGNNLLLAQSRPSLPNSVSNTRFIKHYDASEVTLEEANDILGYAEYSYQRQCVDMGWIEPPSDFGNGGDNKYDIYMYMNEYGDDAITNIDIQDGWNEEWAPSYIFIGPNSYIGGDLKVTVAHEFNHALQMAYSYKDMYNSVPAQWFAENTATLIAEVTWNYKFNNRKLST